MRRLSLQSARWFVLVEAFAAFLLINVGPARAQTETYEFNDSHFHLTNNVQQGPSIHDFLKMMGNKVGRSTVFGVPLQQEWLYGVDGDRAPTYYLHSDAPLYYYSFTDASIAMAYKSFAKGTAGSFRSHDYRLQPRGHVRRGPHPQSASDFPGRVQRYR